jgi:hypothetical protein
VDGEVERAAVTRGRNKTLTALVGAPHNSVLHAFYDQLLVTEVARMLGHSSPHITYKLYAYAIPEGQRQAVAAMGAITARS